MKSLSALVAALALAVPAAGQRPTFRAVPQVTVPVFVTVTDSDGRLVPDLAREDFNVLDDGNSQEVAVFDNAIRPITVVVILDTSLSMTASIPLLRAAAEQFLIRLLPDDRGMVGAFNDKIEFGGGFTADRDELVAEMKDLDYGNGTRLWDAVDASLDQLREVEGRKVILVFTDGDDTSSRTGRGDVTNRARDEDVMVYAIGLETEMFDGVSMVRSRPDRGLRSLAEETGGGHFELKETSELAPAFTRIAQELHSQYVLGFTPTRLDGKVHKLAVKLKRSGLTARARRSYVADPDRFTGEAP